MCTAAVQGQCTSPHSQPSHLTLVSLLSFHTFRLRAPSSRTATVPAAPAHRCTAPSPPRAPMPPSCTMVSVGGILYARTEDFSTILHNRLRSTLNPADAGTSPPPSRQSPLSSSLPSPLPSPRLFPPLFPPLPSPLLGHAGAPNDRQILDGDNLLCDFGCEFRRCALGHACLSYGSHFACNSFRQSFPVGSIRQQTLQPFSLTPTPPFQVNTTKAATSPPPPAPSRPLR